MQLPVECHGWYSSGEFCLLNALSFYFDVCEQARGCGTFLKSQEFNMKTSIRFVIAVAVLLSGASVGHFAKAAEPGDKVTVSIERWRKPGSNNIGTADLAITNGNDFAVKDIRVKCDYMSKVGERKIETDQNIAVTVKAKSTKKFRKTKFAYIDTDKAAGACKVNSATQVQ
jgi:hypothetical protein